MTGLDHVDDLALTMLVLNIKKGIEAAVNEGPSQSEPFHIATGLLATMEAELTKRGHDPTHHNFGFDWTSKIRSMK